MYIHITYSRLPLELMWCFLIYFLSITFILEILREAGVTKPAWPVRPRAGKPQAGQKELEPGLWTPSLCLMSLTRHWLHLVCPHWWHNCKWPGHLFSWSIVFVIKILVKKMWSSLHNAHVSSRRLSVVQRLFSSFLPKPKSLQGSSSVHLHPGSETPPPLGSGGIQLAQGWMSGRRRREEVRFPPLLVVWSDSCLSMDLPFPTLTLVVT